MFKTTPEYKMSESAATPAPVATQRPASQLPASQRPASQLLTAGILGLLGILAIFVALLYISGKANSIHPLSGDVHRGYHLIRMAVSLVAGIVLLAAAGYRARSPRSKLNGRVTYRP